MVSFLLLILSFSILAPGLEAEFSDRFKPAVQLGIIDDFELSEVSGMVASRKNKGKFWVINDSGNQPRIYLIDQTGTIVHSAWLRNGQNIDWEDIAIKNDPETGDPQLIVADIGDNGALRDHIQLLVFDEPDWTNSTQDTIASFECIKLRYKDGPRDAETLLVDPVKNACYIISKREEQVRFYEIPEPSTGSGYMTMAFRGTLPFHNITSGDISVDGSEIVLKNYGEIFYWKRERNQSLLDALKTKHELLHYKPEPQGESISWNLNGTGFYTLSEKSWASMQVMYYYERKSAE